MGNYIVKLADSSGLSCRISLSLPFLQNGTDPTNSEWKVLDGGFLIHHWGGCHMVDTTPGNIFTDGNLLLCRGEHHGVNLYQFAGKLGYANDSGTGVVYQGWAASCKPGQITWMLVE